MEPEYIITLGQKALESVKLIEKVNINLKKHVRQPFNWYGRTLIPLYHMGPRALIHRNFYNQLADFYWLKNTVTIRSKTWARFKNSYIQKVINTDFNPSKLQKLVLKILTLSGPISEFKLTKLLYLVDYYYLQNYGRLLTNSFYIRAYEGPVPAGFDKQLNEMIQRGILSKDFKIYILKKQYKITFSKVEDEAINFVISKYMSKNDREIKTITYMTTPMRKILKLEKKMNKGMLWKPVFSEDDFNK